MYKNGYSNITRPKKNDRVGLNGRPESILTPKSCASLYYVILLLTPLTVLVYDLSLLRSPRCPKSRP